MNSKEFWGTTKQVMIVDIDGTLCEENSFPHYDQAKPIEREIDLLKKIRDHYFIVLWSARYEADREITENWLSRFQVPFDRLVLGKLPYDLFVDWSSLKSLSQLFCDGRI